MLTERITDRTTHELTPLSRRCHPEPCQNKAWEYRKTVGYSLEEIDLVLAETQPVDDSLPTDTLRQWRSSLVRTSVFVSYAIGVISLDIKALANSLASPSEDVLQSLVDDLPALLATEWVGGGWSLSPDASTSVAAAAELAMNESQGLLGLHGQMALSDLGDPNVVHELLIEMGNQRQALIERRSELEGRIRSIQEVVQRQYASGATSIDDWLQG
jgi:hypothetical protein